jgi:hypothetical protein
MFTTFNYTLSFKPVSLDSSDKDLSERTLTGAVCLSAFQTPIFVARTSNP